MTRSSLEVVGVPILDDNYAWLLHDPASDETIAVDPGDAAPVLAAAAARGWRIGQVWNTHWHPDHVAGNGAVQAATGARVSGPAAEAARIAVQDVGVGEGDTLRVGDAVAAVLHVPGHTAGHLAFHLADAKLLFAGDTLFAMGCGRLFEGTAAEMWGSLRRLTALPPATRVYCGHEYTLANARFAASIAPDDVAVATRLAEVDAMRAAGRPTLPTTIAAERATNPFVRAADPDALARLRAAKEAFR